MEIKDLKMEALELLSRMVDNDEECRYDHHEYCQTHFLFEKPCPYGRARELLAELKKEVDNE